jgi:hypothetical protein
MLLVILYHLLNVSVQLANKRGFKKNCRPSTWRVVYIGITEFDSNILKSAPT